MCLEHQSGVLEMSYDFAFSDSSFDSTIIISTVLFLTGKLTGTFKTRNDEMTRGKNRLEIQVSVRVNNYRELTRLASSRRYVD